MQLYKAIDRCFKRKGTKRKNACLEQETYEDTKEVIKSRKSMKNRPYNK